MKQVVIIGGGLAGCASAEAFSRRGWQVQVLEARDRLGGAVAGLPLIAQHPGLTPDFDLRSRLLVQVRRPIWFRPLKSAGGCSRWTGREPSAAWRLWTGLWRGWLKVPGGIGVSGFPTVPPSRPGGGGRR